MVPTDSPEENTPETAGGATDVAEKPPRLNLEVKIDSRGSCQRHLTVVIPREDIDRYFGKVFDELMGSAQVPGFRSGHVPRKLVEHRFRKEVVDQIKSSLLVDSLTQVSEEQNLAPISEPDLNVEDVVLPDEGPLTYEFDIEVRPEFDLPEWKGLSIERPVREFADADLDAKLKKILASRGTHLPRDGGAEPGDRVTVNITASHENAVIGSVESQQLTLEPLLKFYDATLQGFDKLLAGVKAGESRKANVEISKETVNEKWQGKQVELRFDVQLVERLEMPELTPELLADLGSFKNEGELKEAIRSNLIRQVEYQQQQRARQQILAALTQSATWDLPPDLLRRQASRELERSVLELQRSGFSEQEIMAHESLLRQNTLTETKRALTEHFVLERIAEAEKIEDKPADYELEISLIAAQRGESTRRVRAQLEKQNLMDSLRNQIIERKVIEKILDNAKFNEVPYELPDSAVETVEWAIGGGPSDQSDIPTAEHPNEPAKPQT